MPTSPNTAEKPYYNATFSMAESNRNTKATLDVGCGENPYFFHNRLKNYVGIDIDIATLRKICKGLPDVSLVCASGSHAPFRDGVFDVIICTEVLEHLEDPRNAVREMFRLLAEKGVAIVSIPSLSLPQTAILWIAYRTGRISSKPYQSPNHFREYARFTVTPHFQETREFFCLLKQEGLEVKDIATAQSLYTSPKVVYDILLARIERVLDKTFSKCLVGHYTIIKAQKTQNNLLKRFSV
jgi:SAM-dependent methyltransferase